MNLDARNILRQTALVLAALGAAAALSAEAGREEFSRTFQKTLPLNAGQTLSIDHRNGDIRVRTHPEPQVAIDARIRVSSSDRQGAEKFSNDIRIEVESGGSGVSIRTVFPEKSWTFSGQGYVSYSVDYDIALPEGAVLKARNRFGDVDVQGLKAGADISDSNGKVAVRSTRGSLRVENSFGSVDVAGSAGPTTIVNVNGSVTVADVAGDLDVSDRFGGVRVSKVSGRCTVINGNGDAVVDGVGGAAKLTNSFGKVDVRGVGGALEVDNANGRIAAREVKGGARLTTRFGEIDAAGIGGDATVSNSNGAIALANVEGSADVH
ncbi:MAG TPA: hypothetical protein VKJ00_03360, partial [Thermoanaerobaculia bacterium]|nr:hypothetical protein [Thermoanaerobaculia bacterium]